MMYGRYAGTPIRIGDDEHVVMSESDVLGVKGDKIADLKPTEVRACTCLIQLVCDYAWTRAIKAGTACHPHHHNQSITAAALTPHTTPPHAAELDPSQRTAQQRAQRSQPLRACPACVGLLRRWNAVHERRCKCRQRWQGAGPVGCRRCTRRTSACM